MISVARGLDRRWYFGRADGQLLKREFDIKPSSKGGLGPLLDRPVECLTHGANRKADNRRDQ
jgi:hypothetical protein